MPRRWRSGLPPPRISGGPRPTIMTGDVALFTALVSALDLAPAWKRRLVKDFNRKASLAQDLERLTLHAPNGKADYQGVLAALAGSDPKAARALVTDLLSIAGISAVGGRSVGEIADRFLEQSTLGASAALPRDTHDLVVRFLGIGGTSDDAAARRCASSPAKADSRSMPRSICFEARNADMKKRGIDMRRVAFSCAFGRGMDYYTGFVFELTRRRSRRAAGRGRPLRRSADPARFAHAYSRRRLLGLDRAAVGFACGSRRHERAQQAASDHRGAGQGPPAGECGEFLRARRPATRQAARRARLSRHHRRDWTASRSRICRRPKSPRSWRQGAAHLGVTGEDLVREMMPDADARVILLEGLGFGYANVVVAVPQAWIDVRSMADLDDVATAFRLQP